MRLGEGTGAVLTFPLIESAVRIYNEMATFGLGRSQRGLRGVRTLREFAAAVQFMTRIPVPAFRYEPDLVLDAAQSFIPWWERWSRWERSASSACCARICRRR